MKRICNLKGKTVCYIDEKSPKVEIVKDKCKTIITFNKDGTATVYNEKLNS